MHKKTAQERNRREEPHNEVLLLRRIWHEPPCTLVSTVALAPVFSGCCCCCMRIWKRTAVPLHIADVTRSVTANCALADDKSCFLVPTTSQSAVCQCLRWSRRAQIRMHLWLALAVVFALTSSCLTRENLHLDGPRTSLRDSDDEAQCVTQEGRPGRCALKRSCNAQDLDKLPACFSILPFLESVCCPFNPAPGAEFRNVDGEC